MNELFRPPGESWNAIQPAYGKLKRLSVLTWYGSFGICATVLTGVFLSWIWAIIPAVVVGGVGTWRWLRQLKLAAAIGYCERGTDLCIVHGLAFKHMTIVPYGRMQTVDISAGPIAKRFGLVKVELVTASAMTGASIPGLAPDEAASLRDRMLAMGEHKDAGL